MMPVNALLLYLEDYKKKVDVKANDVSLKSVRIKSHEWLDKGAKLCLQFHEGHSICVDLGENNELVLLDENCRSVSKAEVIATVKSLEADGVNNCSISICNACQDDFISFTVVKERRVPTDYWGVDYFHKTHR